MMFIKTKYCLVYLTYNTTLILFKKDLTVLLTLSVNVPTNMAGLRVSLKLSVEIPLVICPLVTFFMAVYFP